MFGSQLSFSDRYGPQIQWLGLLIVAEALVGDREVTQTLRVHRMGIAIVRLGDGKILLGRSLRRRKVSRVTSQFKAGLESPELGIRGLRRPTRRLVQFRRAPLRF